MTPIVQSFLSDSDLEQFFQNAGYATKKRLVTVSEPSYHNRTEFFQVPKVMVINDEGKELFADELYQKVMRQRMLTPDPTTVTIVNDLLNNDK